MAKNFKLLFLIFIALATASFKTTNFLFAAEISQNQQIKNQKVETQQNKNLQTKIENSQVQVENPQNQKKSAEFYTIPEATRKSVGISGLNKSSTKKFREFYMSDSKQIWLSEVLYDSIPYRPYIIQQLKRRKMPLCLQFLPIVESNYKVKATSPSGAKGLWQFMENSMSPYMQKNWWYDERLDPWKETDAALSKLTENYKTFGDWAFALAAYNMGAGAIKKIQKQYPGKDYWWLAENGKIRKETADYVPKLLAISDLIMNAEYWGLLRIAACDKRIENVAPETFSYIKITGSVSFETISKASGISVSTLEFLNPALLHNATPSKSTWRLRLPKGSAKKVAEDLRAYLKKQNLTD